MKTDPFSIALRAAFKDVRRAGYNARINFDTNKLSEAERAAWHAKGGIHSDVWGSKYLWVHYWHEGAEDNAVQSREKTVALGKLTLGILKRHGLTAEWSGNYFEAIQVTIT